MSAGYGYYGFYVVKKDGSPDPKKAKDRINAARADNAGRAMGS